MGYSCIATCLDCAHQWSLEKGGGFVFAQHVCNRCGKCRNLPRLAPQKGRAPMSREVLRRYVKASGRWVHDGRPFVPVELELIADLFGRCGCGGTLLNDLDPNAVYRCPERRSARYSEGPIDCLFD